MYGKIALFKRVVSTCSLRYSKKSSSKKLLEFLADMPKHQGNISKVRQQRINNAKMNEKYCASTIYLQVLGSGARGVPNTLYLFTDQRRYLFNCGEGTQRLAHEHKVKLSKLEHIFITSKTWRNIGGLPGISLTLQDVGLPNITLHGPEGLDELYTATRRFVIMKDMNVQMAKCSPSEDYSDNVMSVKYVLLGPDDNLLESDPQPVAKKAKTDDEFANSEFEEFIHDSTDYYNKPNKQTEIIKNKSPKYTRSPEKDPIKTKTEKVLQDLKKKTKCTVAYICTFQKRYGTLDLQKCVEKGVPPGPILGKLKLGEDVVLKDGTLVLSKDVKTPDDPGPVFIVLEVPDISYLKEAEFSAHFDNGANPRENVPAVIVHYTPPHVFHHPTYRAFMSMFGPTCKHLVLNDQNPCLGSEAVHRTQHKLHLLDADIFPLLRDVSLPAVWHTHPPPQGADSPEKLKGLEELKNKIALAQFQNIINMEGCCKGDGAASEEDAANKLEVIAGRTLTMVHLRPRKEVDRSAEPKLQIEEYIKEAMVEDGFAASLEQFRKVVDKVRYAKNASHKEYPKVVFLGTGSCIPSKTRNTSAIVIQVNENRSMLLDCGEGTFGQLVRFYGPKRVNAFLRTLKAIYVSHLHADHHLGLFGVLQARRKALDELSPSETVDDSLYLLAPGQIVSWLATYDMHFENVRNELTLVPNQNLLVNTDDGSSPGLTAGVLASMGVQAVRTCYVPHCPNAFGVHIDIDGEHKITYSGDTLPCDELVNLGKDSTLLIHEATMEDELADEARYKMHSTTSQAIDVGRRMNAKYTVLTHFSQRYARLPRLNSHILNHNTSVGIAFDNMQITMSDLDLLPHMYAPLQLMFAEHCVDMEMKAAQRASKKARKLSPPPDNNAKKSNNCQDKKSEPAAHNTTPVYRDSNASNNNPKESNNGQDTKSAPATHTIPMYRDTNASRLRNEIRRMVSSGPMKRGSRSKSCSSAKSANSATPKSHNSENASLERPIDVTTPRTISDSSNIDKKAQDKSRVVSNGRVIDTRSKTLNSASAAQSTDKVSDDNVQMKKNELISPPKGPNGYGKPLVTPLNKKILIRRAQDTVSSANAGSEKYRSTTPAVNRCKSPVKSWKAENRPSSSSVVSTKIDLNKSKIPMKDTGPSGHTARRSNAGPTRPDIVKGPTRSTMASPASAITTIQQRISNSTARTRSADRKPQGKDPILDTKSLTRTNSPTFERKIRSWNSDSRSPVRSSSRSQTPSGMRLRSSSMKDSRTKSIERCQNQNKEKRNTTKDDNQAVLDGTKTKSLNHSNRSFKPQLEDIKSSYLLLNKNNIDRNINKPVDNDKFNISKLYLNDNIRRIQLLEIKQKYKSREFWHDSKYDKIEGLNWITWK